MNYDIGMKENGNTMIGVLLGIIIVLALGGAFYLGTRQPKNQAASTSVQVTPTPTVEITSSPAVKPSPAFEPISDPNVKRFISETLGITFTYKLKNGPDTITAKEIGDKVYVYLNTWQPEKGQYAQIFHKNPGDSLEQAIDSSVLKGYSTVDCILADYKQGKYPAGFQAKMMTVPTGPNDGLPEMSTKAEKCPQGYMSIGGLTFFLYDPSFPDRFVFFSIGQYAIDSANGQTWQDTLRFF